MSVIRTALILGCALGIHQAASAACTLTTQKFILSPEIVNDKQSIQSGGVIQTRTLSRQNIQASGCTDNHPFSAQIIGDRSAMKQPGIIRSNVSGIGIKVTLETSTGQTIQWPSTFRATADEFRNSKIKIELIKLDDQPLRVPSTCKSEVRLNRCPWWISLCRQNISRCSTGHAQSKVTARSTSNCPI